MLFTIETAQEEDGRWIAEVLELPGAMKYGRSEAEAMAQAEALALRVLAERIEANRQADGTDTGRPVKRQYQ
jgi:predicted RNase H-like HicB family nuclease